MGKSKQPYDKIRRKPVDQALRHTITLQVNDEQDEFIRSRAANSPNGPVAFATIVREAINLLMEQGPQPRFDEGVEAP